MALRETISEGKDSDSAGSPGVRGSPDSKVDAPVRGGLRQTGGNRAGLRFLENRYIKPNLQVGSPGGVFLQEVDSVPQAVVEASRPSLGETLPSLHTGPRSIIPFGCAKCEQEEEETIRRSPKDGAEGTTEAAGEQPSAVETAPESSATEQAQLSSEETPAEPTTEEKAGATLLVDDDAEKVVPGQMRKADFLDSLRESVCAAANEALAPTGQTTENCPWMDHWFTEMEGKDAAHVERVIRKFAPETAGATTAQDYIPLVTARVRRSVEQWATTGEISGLPEGITPDIPGLGVMGGLAGGLGGMFFKARAGGPRAVSDAQAIRHQLGTGRPLPGGVRSRIESAFGMSFSQVRIHTDSPAALLSDQLNARAFTVGEHVAFGPGEYQPGTLVGDALLAHEMAHVVQQGGAKNSRSPMLKVEGEDNSLEQDADRSAVGAVASLWGTAHGRGSRIPRESVPRLRSGLGLSRCGGTDSKAAEQTVKKPACTAPSAKDWKASFAAADSMPPDKQPDAKLALVRQALCPLAINDVRLAGTKHADAVDPEDYAPYPAINFDVGLNGKQSWPQEGARCKGASPPAEGCNTRVLNTNYGYNFRDGSTLYVVLGPNALSPETPAYTQRNVQHEIYLATKDTAKVYKRGQAPKFSDDAELDAWTNDFVGYFHLLGWKARGPASKGGAPIYFGEGWQKLVDRYYESSKTSGEARKRAEDRLVAYFNSPPSSEPSAGRPGHPTDPAGVKELFLLWLDRREEENPDRRLIKALRARKLTP